MLENTGERAISSQATRQRAEGSETRVSNLVEMNTPRVRDTISNREDIVRSIARVIEAQDKEPEARTIGYPIRDLASCPERL